MKISLMFGNSIWSIMKIIFLWNCIHRTTVCLSNGIIIIGWIIGALNGCR
jgi:hypothetical protein